MARKRAASLSEGTTTKRIKTTNDPTPPLRHSTRVQQAREARDASFDESDGEDLSAKPTKGKAKPRASAKVAAVPQKAECKSTAGKDPPKSTKDKTKARTPGKQTKTTPSPPQPRYNTRSKQLQDEDTTLANLSDDDKDVEELPLLPHWPRYKDDLPNVFNGKVDPEKDFISKVPVEVIDSILSFLLLDHDPELGVKEKKGGYKPRPHVLISMAAMSKLFYHATEGHAQRFLIKNKDALTPSPSYANEDWYRAREKAIEDKENSKRRSTRIANQPKPEVVQIYRKQLLSKLRWRCAVCFSWTGSYAGGKFANAVSVCRGCERIDHGYAMTLTEALKSYDLRDYMLLKSRTPGPRAKSTDLPAILYGSKFKAIGFPVFKRTTVFYFRPKDVRMIAGLVHGDVGKHMQEKENARAERQQKARTKRVRAFIIAYHERRLETAVGKLARRHRKRLKQLRALPSDVAESGVYTRFGCTKRYCYHDIGLCQECGDIPGRDDVDCRTCYFVFMDRRYDQYYSKVLGTTTAAVSNG